MDAYVPRGEFCKMCVASALQTDCGGVGWWQVVRLVEGGRVHGAWAYSNWTMCGRRLPMWADLNVVPTAVRETAA
jgi:hypothetical protein